jgi:hypothetical protein
VIKYGSRGLQSTDNLPTPQDIIKAAAIALDATGPLPYLHNRQIAEPLRELVSFPLFPTASDAPACCQAVEQLIALEYDNLALEDLERLSRKP